MGPYLAKPKLVAQHPHATPVSLHLQGRDFTARADLVTDPAAVAIQLLEYVRLLPAAAGPLGLRSPATAATTATRLSADRLFVHIQTNSCSPRQTCQALSCLPVVSRRSV